MTTTRLTGLGIVAGTAAGLLVALLAGAELALGITAGAVIGLLIGAVLDVRRPPRPSLTE